MKAAWAIATALLPVLGCESPPLGTVGTTLLAQAARVEKLPRARVPTIEVNVGEAAPPVPDGPVVHVAIAREVPWSTVDAVRRAAKPGQRLVMLAATRRIVGELVLEDPLEAEPIRLFTTDRGKACVSPPGVAEAKCVQRGDKKHIDRAFVRELIREATKGYGIRDVVVELPPTIQWGDAVRAVDGARTCCKNFRPRVSVKSL